MFCAIDHGIMIQVIMIFPGLGMASDSRESGMLLEQHRYRGVAIIHNKGVTRFVCYTTKHMFVLGIHKKCILEC